MRAVGTGTVSLQAEGHRDTGEGSHRKTGAKPGVMWPQVRDT